MATPTPTPASRADWYPDPTDPRLLRYWDGRRWTAHTAPKPYGSYVAPATARVPWWQTWWVVVPGLFLCLPFGLVGLWRRQGLALGLRVGLTVGAVMLFGAVLLTDDDDGPSPTSAEPSTPAAGSASPTPTPTSEPTPVRVEPARAVVPGLTGLSLRKAEKRLTALGLVVLQGRKVPSTEPPGTVLGQSRKVGASVLAGSVVTVTIAAPYPRVPDVVGLTRSAAVSRLRDAGFKVTWTTEVRTTGKDGVILRQTPAGSRRAEPHSTIAVVVASVVRTVAPPPQPDCTDGYSPCLEPASDYDCAGGSGNGPEYAYGPVYVTGYDPYDLDSDGDGVACES